MNENYWTDPATGRRYRTQEQDGCRGCALHSSPTCASDVVCDSSIRSDGRSVIWVPDDAPTPMAELTAEPAFPGTLRDWFAGMALAGMLAHPDTELDSDNLPQYMRQGPYVIADAMMQAREARNG